MGEGDMVRRGAPPRLLADLVAWARSQRCDRCGGPLHVPDGLVASLMVPSVTIERVVLEVLEPGDAARAAALEDAGPWVVLMHARCSADLAAAADRADIAATITATLERP